MLTFARISKRGTAVPLPTASISLDFAQTECPLRHCRGLQGTHCAEGRHGYYCKHFYPVRGRRPCVGVECTLSLDRPRRTVRSRSGAEKSGRHLPALSGDGRVRCRGTRQPDRVRCLGRYDRTPTPPTAETASRCGLLDRVFRRHTTSPTRRRTAVTEKTRQDRLTRRGQVTSFRSPRQREQHQPEAASSP